MTTADTAPIGPADLSPTGSSPAPASDRTDRPGRFLLVSRVGPRSLHGNWLAAGEDRGFDVFLSAYAPSVEAPDLPGVFFETRPGFKIAGYAGFMRDHADLLKTYDYVAFFDEDLDTSAAAIAGMFRLCRARRLKIAQPALTHDSHFTFAGLLQQPQFTLRYVNFIEMMCPIFRSDVLLRIRPLFERGYESGIDLVWCNVVHEGPRDFAVLDAFPLRHTRPVGNSKAENGFSEGKTYDDDIFAVLDAYGLPWLSLVPYEAETTDGRRVAGRFRLLTAAMRILRAVPRQKPFVARLHLVLIHLRHLLVRQPLNLPPRDPQAAP